MPHVSRLPLLVATLLLVFVACIASPAQARANDMVAWEDPGGAPHWYEVVAVPAGIDWAAANAAAAARGGHLATITSKEENDVVFKLIDHAGFWQLGSTVKIWHGPWIGGVQGESALEPHGGWVWAEPDHFGFTNWASGQPDNRSNADRMHYGGSATGRSAEWADAPAVDKRLAYIVEYDGSRVPDTMGLLERVPDSFDGYTLIAPTRARLTYLIDPQGRVVKWWSSKYIAGIVAYLLPNGNLLRTGFLDNKNFAIGGAGGIVEEFDWDGNLVWEYTHSSAKHCLHHDVERMPNGNVLMVSWEEKTEAEALTAGRDPKLLPENRLLPDKIIEVAPTGPKSGQIVWEWHTWDHLIQDHDPTKANYGKVENHPERIDVNYVAYNGRADWMHFNAVAYNWQLDQIVMSVRSFDEVWIIDHSTTTSQAASGAGGRSGMGGRLLYRYGNPRAYRQGTAQDQKLFKQHDAHWIPHGLPGAGNLLIFNNGVRRPDGSYSSVDELTLKPDARGLYARTAGVWGPDKLTWTYQAPNKTDFFSMFVSGAQRQPNGNTLICAGWRGDTFEVTPQGEVVWHYMNPVHGGEILPQGHPGRSGPTVFRSYRYGPEYGAFANKTLKSGDPVEIYTKTLLADGSRNDRIVALGHRTEFDLISKGDEDRFYLLGTSMTAGTLQIGHRFLGIGYDALLPFSMTQAAPAIFSGYFGRFDSKGRATASFQLPKMTWLKGLSFYTAFLVFDPAAPKGVSTLSNTVRIEAQQ